MTGLLPTKTVLSFWVSIPFSLLVTPARYLSLMNLHSGPRRCQQMNAPSRGAVARNLERVWRAKSAQNRRLCGPCSDHRNEAGTAPGLLVQGRGTPEKLCRLSEVQRK